MLKDDTLNVFNFQQHCSLHAHSNNHRCKIMEHNECSDMAIFTFSLHTLLHDICIFLHVYLYIYICIFLYFHTFLFFYILYFSIFYFFNLFFNVRVWLCVNVCIACLCACIMMYIAVLTVVRVSREAGDAYSMASTWSHGIEEYAK